MRRLVDVNLMGTLYAARAALGVMRRQGHGHIIAVSSIAGRRGIGGSSVYSATKAAQIGFIEVAARGVRRHGLHASVVYPVSTTTEFHDAIARDFGYAVRRHGPSQSADAVARAIVGLHGRPRAEVYPYRRTRWLAVLNVVAPAQADRFVRGSAGAGASPGSAAHGAAPAETWRRPRTGRGRSSERRTGAHRRRRGSATSCSA